MEILLFSYCGRVFLGVGSTHQKYQVKRYFNLFLYALVLSRCSLSSRDSVFDKLRRSTTVRVATRGATTFDPHQRRALQRRRSLGELHTGPRRASQYKVVGELPMGPTLINRTDRMSESGKFRTFVEASRVPILMSG